MATKLWVGTDTPGDWSVAANWSPSGVPIAADDVFLTNSSQAVDLGLDQSLVTLASLTIDQSFTGNVGTIAAYLQISATVCTIGNNYLTGNPAGSQLIKIDFGSNAAAVSVLNTGVSSDLNLPTARFLCNHASTTIEVRKGKVGIAVETGETSTLLTATVGFVTQRLTDADLFIGDGVTLTNLNQNGGDVTCQSAFTTATLDNGMLIVVGEGAVTTANVRGGTYVSNSSGLLGTLNITGGLADFSKSAIARTVTNAKIDAPGKISFDSSIVTFTNNIEQFSASGNIVLTAA